MKKVALVTGGAKGIGSAIVKRLINDGYKVAFTYNSSEEQATALANDFGENCKAFKLDIADSNAVKNVIDDIDLEHSFVLVESVTLAERKSIYAFMKYAGDFYSDNFDIEDYVKGDWDENDYKRMNDMNLMIDNKERIDMKSFMDGDINTQDLE